jgi:hypothetical protein
LKSLREVCMGLASCESPLKHLGISETPSKSTLAYANANRPWQLYQTVFTQLLGKCQAEVAARGGRRKFRFKNKLMSLDGSIIDLSATMFDWAKYRRTKGAIKVHLLLDHDGYLPSFAVVTEGKRSELEVARSLRLEAGTILAIDRGYNDYEWFAQMTRDGVYCDAHENRQRLYGGGRVRGSSKGQYPPGSDHFSAESGESRRRSNPVSTGRILE